MKDYDTFANEVFSRINEYNLKHKNIQKKKKVLITSAVSCALLIVVGGLAVLSVNRTASDNTVSAESYVSAFDTVPIVFNDPVSSSENSKNHNSDVSGMLDDDYTGTAEASEEIYDFYGNTLEEINRLYAEYIRQHGDRSIRQLNLNPLYNVFTVKSIISGEGYYTLDSESGWIHVYDTDVVYDEQTLFEFHIRNRDYLTVESIGIYSDYQTVRDNEFLLKYPVCCLIYEKEGIKVYAISDGSTDNYDIYCGINGVYFGFGKIDFNYPNETGVLRAKDEWSDLSGGGEAFAELSDVTTESSALIRALKEAVGMDG